MLDIRNVVKIYAKNVKAVDDVSLNLPAGVVGLIGHNGAGKTSLMQMIATLTRPTSGQILFDGVDIAGKPEAIRGLLEMVNLHEHAGRQAAGFSGGMRRRLGIAQALLNDPDVLIVDEPTAGLDPEERLRFRHLLSEIGFRKLVIVSTHIVSDIENMASHLAIMNKGKLVGYDTPDSFVREARSQVWSATVEPRHYETLRAQVRVLQAQRNEHGIHLRIAHPSSPCAGALPAEPTLEEALMTQRYAIQEQAA
jgi:ABC-2 type transport system ATP-binding protein